MNGNPAKPLFVFIILWGSALSATQTILLREYMCFSGGNEISLGLLLAVWLLFNSAGAFLMGFGIDSEDGRRLFLLPLCGFLFAILSVFFLRYAHVILSLEKGTLADVKTLFIASLIAVSLPALASGISFPYLSSILKKQRGSLSIAFVYGTESLGLLLGYLLTVILLKLRWQHLSIICIIYGFVLVSLTLWGRGKNRFLRFFISAISVLVAVIFFSYADKSVMKDSFERINRGYRYVQGIETNYNRYIIAQRNSQYVLFVNNIFSGLIGDEYSSKITAHLVMSLSDSHKNVLVLGEASYDLLKHISEYKSDIDYVENDAHLKSFIRENSLLKETNTGNIRFIQDDQRKYVKSSRKKYDIVFADTGEALSLQTNRYYTSEFFSEVSNILNRDGIFITRLIPVTSVPSGPKLDYLVSVFNALKKNFPYVSALDYGSTILAASFLPVDLRLEKVVSRYTKDVVSGCDFEPEILSIALQEENNRRIQNLLENGGRRINLDLNPSALLSGLVLWEMSVSEKGDSVLSVAAGYGTIFIYAALLILFLLAFYFRRKRYVYPATVIFFQGFLSMALELIIVYRFQVESGTLYYYVALLFSSYMGGLSAGSFLTRIVRSRHYVLLAGNLLLVLLLYIRSLPVFLLVLLLFINGTLTGILFGRLSGYLVVSENNPIKRSSSVIDFSDCMGGVLASLMIPLVLIPLSGLEYSLNLIFVIGVLILIFSAMTEMSRSES